MNREAQRTIRTAPPKSRASFRPERSKSYSAKSPKPSSRSLHRSAAANASATTTRAGYSKNWLSKFSTALRRREPSRTPGTCRRPSLTKRSAAASGSTLASPRTPTAIKISPSITVTQATLRRARDRAKNPAHGKSETAQNSGSRMVPVFRPGKIPLLERCGTRFCHHRQGWNAAHRVLQRCPCNRRKQLDARFAGR